MKAAAMQSLICMVVHNVNYKFVIYWEEKRKKKISKVCLLGESKVYTKYPPRNNRTQLNVF